MSSIFHIEQQFAEIFAELEDNGGELTPGLEDALAITQNDFENKVANYVEIIKSINADIAAIDVETKRLKEYKDTKKKLKEKLSNILCRAISLFGDKTKSGGSYVDLGIEKVSVRNTTKLETDDDLVTEVAKDVNLGYANIAVMNSWDETAIDTNYFIERAKNHVEVDEETGEQRPYPLYVTPENYDEINAEIKISVPLSTLINEEGVDFMRNLMNMTTVYNVTGSVNKSALKAKFKQTDTTSNNIAKLVPNQTLSIK